MEMPEGYDIPPYRNEIDGEQLRKELVQLYFNIENGNTISIRHELDILQRVVAYADKLSFYFRGLRLSTMNVRPEQKP